MSIQQTLSDKSIEEHRTVSNTHDNSTEENIQFESSLRIQGSPVSGFVNQLHSIWASVRRLRPRITKSTDDDQASAQRTVAITPLINWTRLCALYRKDYIICKWKRNFWKSAFELLIPIVFLVYVAFLRGHERQLGGKWKDPETYPYVHLNSSIDFKANASKILYAPITNYTNTVVPNAFNNSESCPVFMGFKKISELVNYLENQNPTDVALALIFESDTALEYSILWPSMNVLFENHLKFHGLRPYRTALKPSPKIKFFPTPRRFVPSGSVEPTTLVPSILSVVCFVPKLFFAVEIIRDKKSHMKDLLYMMCLPQFVYWLNIFLVGFSTLAILMCTAWVFFCYPIFGSHMYASSDPSLILTIFILFAAAEVLQILLITVIFNSTVFGGVAVVGVFYLSLFSAVEYTREEDYIEVSAAIKLASALLPVNGLQVIGNIITNRELSNVGVRWTNIAVLERPPDNVSLLAMLMAVLFSCVMYSFLIFYLNAIIPWQSGTPKHLFFLCQSASSSSTQNFEINLSGSTSNRASMDPGDPSNLIEKVTPGTASPIIKMCNVTHQFGNKKVLDHLSLELYRNQVTVLLGHNGAGKTTLMGILTGLFPPTSGSVHINGFDVQKNPMDARRGIGVCPQMNALFDDLTVKEHLEFFYEIKGGGEDKEEIEKLISQFGLTPEQDELADTLSDGTKRRLCIANAMVGGSNIIILDEPTTGMDHHIRSKVWRILQRAHRDRTILMTTHNMNEADVLGDRIIILANGRIKCAGSPLFLKKTFETGYNLRCVKASPNTFVNLTVEQVQRCLKNTQVQRTSEGSQEFSVRLGFPTTEQFINLFRELEKKKVELGIVSWGVTVTTMEDIFFKATKSNEMEKSFSNPSDASISRLPVIIRSTGILLYLRQFHALFLKRVRVIRRQWFMLIHLFVIPCIFAVAFCGLTRSLLDPAGMKEPALTYSFQSFPQRERSEGFVQRSRLGLTYKSYMLKLVMEEDDLRVHVLDQDTNVEDFLLNKANTSRFDYKNLWKMGVTFDHSKPTEAILWINAEPFHVVAAGLVLWQTAVLRQLLRKSEYETAIVNVRNHPFSHIFLKYANTTYEIEVRHLVHLLIQLAVSFSACTMILFPIEERLCKAKLLQMMTGVSRTVYLGASFTFDLLTILVSATAISFALAICNAADSLAEEIEIGAATCLLLSTYGAMMILVSYACSYMFSSLGAGFAMLLLVTAIGGGIIVPLLLGAVLFLTETAEYIPFAVNCVPQIAVLMGLSNLRLMAKSKKFCENFTPTQLTRYCQGSEKRASCCQPCSVTDPSTKFCYKREDLFQIDLNAGIGFQMIVLLTGTGLALGLLIATESGLLGCCFRLLTWVVSPISQQHSQNTAVGPSQEDTDVIIEQHRVENAIATGNQSRYALLAQNLTKMFGPLMVVNQISFAVKKKECFGILGVNGSGKSTTLNMITGDLEVDDGNVYVKNSNLRTSLRLYQTYIGFCPQSDVLLDKLSGKEMLELFCALRGVPRNQQASLIEHIVSLFDLEPHTNKMTSTYSGGTKRKLSICLAIIGNMPMIILDEPTVGIDPSARRKIWSMITETQNRGSAVILASRSVDECEAVCDRMAVVVNGTFQCLGSLQELRSKFGQGFMVVIKLKSLSDNSLVPRVIEEMGEHFPGDCVLKDRQQCLLHFHIMNRKLLWSELFEKVQKVKKAFDFEDVVVSDSSLEQMFFAFTETKEVVSV
ncbi:retinal-specific ATP-binding cassette transporter-like isoform X3 [Varroa destructor]|uniref:ABC transporter domain-containing protein n=1 Tax=Varroa destructor TaxID=109461 RepID=A0A7M7K4S4_VARDE|nr:retinal-specific ATP-binding cassette transporter-like isoform X3 [Varroa destructor]